MADSPETITTLEGNFKQQYPNGLPDLVPNGAKLQKMVKFVSKDLELGDSYIQPVRLTYPNGFTHKASGSGAFSLEDALPGQLKKAIVDGSQILLRDQVDMESAAKASNGNKKAFEDIETLTFQSMQKSMRKRIESELFYGAKGIGTVSSISGSGATRTVTFAASGFAPGIWSGLENCYLDLYDSTGATQRNSSGKMFVVSVDIDAKTASITAAAAGDWGSVVSTDIFWYRNAKGNEMSGIAAILSNTGTLFNISASTYSLWKASSVSLTGALSFNAVKKAVAKAVGKGLDEGVNLFVNPGGWDDMMTDIAALRRTDKSEVGKVEIGAEEIVFHTQAGKCTVIPSIFVKEGDAFGLCDGGYWKRIGATDVTFNMPGFGEQLFFVLPSNAGVEARAYTNQAIFCDAPARNFYISGIVNSTAV